jgi:hypothetical protein
MEARGTNTRPIRALRSTGRSESGSLAIAARRQCRSGSRYSNARPLTFGPSWSNRQERFDKIPQRAGSIAAAMPVHATAPTKDQVSEVFCTL